MTQPRLDIGEIAAGPPRRRVRIRWAVVAVSLTITIGGLVFWQVQRSNATSVRYVTEPVMRGDITVIVTATGTVEPTTTVEISSELSGTITTVNVDFNDVVVEGEVLAQLDTAQLEATVAHARAARDAAAARVAQARVTLNETREARDRTLQLEERGITTREALLAAVSAHERAVAALEIAEADLAVAEADLRVNETNLAKACICSPINGIVLQRNVDPGQIVAASFAAPVLFTLAEDLRRMELLVDIDEADVGMVEIGDPATFTVEAWRDLAFPAVISELRFAPETVDGVVTYGAVLAIANEQLLLRPGMTAVADITVDEVTDTLRVPNAALRFVPPADESEDTEAGSGLLGMLFRDTPGSGGASQNLSTQPGQRQIWVLRDAEAVQVQIATGATDGLRTQVLGGDIAEGDLVITDMETAP